MSLATVGVIAVAATSLEMVLIPGAIIGVVAVFGPRQLARLRPRGRKKALSFAKTNDHPFRFSIGRFAAKTVTFRVISSGLDFGWNYLLLGEVAVAAGLSGFSLVAAPVFYFLHETAWSRFHIGGGAIPGSESLQPGENPRISRAMAKTVSFRAFATVAEFATNYFVVRDVVLAAKLSAFGFVAGPFVYLAHEKAWEYYAPEKSAGAGEKLLAAPVRS